MLLKRCALGMAFSGTDPGLSTSEPPWRHSKRLLHSFRRAHKCPMENQCPNAPLAQGGVCIFLNPLVIRIGLLYNSVLLGHPRLTYDCNIYRGLRFDGSSAVGKQGITILLMCGAPYAQIMMMPCPVVVGRGSDRREKSVRPHLFFPGRVLYTTCGNTDL